MANWLEAYTETNGIRMHSYRTGGAKPQLILLHGILDNGLCWTPIARVLESSYDVIMLDARGHGLSDGPESGFSIELMAADVAGFIQAAGLERPFILGHSMGAATALVLAARYPDSVRAVLLEDPPLRDTPISSEADTKLQQPNPWLAWLLVIQAQTPEERINSERERSHWSDEELVPWAEAKAQFNLAVLERNVSKALRVDQWRDVVRQIRCPLLLITGEHERGAIVTRETASEVGTLNPEAQVLFIPASGHNIRRDQPAPYRAAIIDFLQQH